jgi:hypothetical protein
MFALENQYMCVVLLGRIQWRPSVKRVDELGGYEKLWKARTTHIPIKDSLGPLATRPPFTEVKFRALVISVFIFCFVFVVNFLSLGD